MQKGEYCSGCKQSVAKLDKNGYCSRCSTRSLGASVADVALDTMEKFATKFMPKWLFKLIITVATGALFYYIS
ncbi:MAG: hypothetical protein K2Y14_02385 [Burkholderiales bacterium]|nr:hypothetical protein [Burkholderiales bacterium]